MNITNKYGLPRVFELMANKDSYTKGEAQFSVTELIAPPRIRVLQREHEKEIVRDVSDMLWPLLGKTIHKVLEDRASAGSIAEQRLYAEVDGVVVSGGIDLQVVNGNEVDVTDWKFTSTWAIDQDKREWEEQLNVYGWLTEVNGRLVRDLNIVAILRDWSKAQSERDQNYPQAPVARIRVPLWPTAKAEAFVKARIKLHAQAHYLHAMGEQVPECSDEEKWMSEPKWVVIKLGGKRAMKLFDTQSEAIAFLAAKVIATNRQDLRVQSRPAEPIRCKRNYCNVAQWCSFGNQFHQGTP